ncbi:ATP-grasp fold amidoligase family protein [Helicobacter pullorum]|uniref:ATP-grasp fold amidoligase family protein n=1 Tax=Helicobacter pullorum TaxID=35818 RepID=UPI0031EBA07D
MGGGGNNSINNNPFSQVPQVLTQSKIFLEAYPSLLFQPLNSLKQLLFETSSCPFLPKLYAIYKNVDEIDFSVLPDSFVLKTNHDSGGVVIVPDKNEFLKDSKVFKKAMEKLTKHLKTNYYSRFREYHYKDIEPWLFAEELLGRFKDNASKSSKNNFKQTLQSFEIPDDYKFHCFGKEIFVQVDKDRFTNHTRTIFNDKWEKMPFSYCYRNCLEEIPKPKHFEEMKEVARILSEDFAMIRIDMYHFRECFIIGELTFAPEAGKGIFTPREWDKKFGDLWKLR